MEFLTRHRVATKVLAPPFATRVAEMADSKQMGIGSGRFGPSTALMTREVRWFHDGPLPTSVRDWFTTHSPQTEQRVDYYDLASARNGIGRKHRDSTSLDTKFRIDVFPSTPVAPGFTGQVEDWMKISEPLGESREHALTESFPVGKSLITIRIPLWDDGFGCDAELADITAGGMRAWSLCFETFGAHERREDALAAGVHFVTETPPPNGVVFDQETSLPYPDWLAQLAYQRT
jgi:hypothetical protein